MKKSIIILLFIVLNLFFSASKAQKTFTHPEGKFITVNGAKLWIEISGKGEPLFLIAGGPGESHLYLHSMDQLKDSFMLVFIDNFGRGKSDTAKNISEYSIDRDVNDVEGIRVALGFDKINLLGHSYGSLVAQSYALKYGNHLKHLIIADGFYSGKMWQENDNNSNHEFAENDPELWDSLMAVRAKGFKSFDPEQYNIYFAFHSPLVYLYNPDNYRRMPKDASYPNNFNTKLYYRYVGDDGDFVVGNEIAKYDVTDQLKDLKMPVLIIAGRYDRVSVPKFSVLYKKYCPQATFLMLNRSGHNPQIEEPDLYFYAVRKFLK